MAERRHYLTRLVVSALPATVGPAGASLYVTGAGEYISDGTAWRQVRTAGLPGTYTGGTVGRVVRYTTGGAWTDAANTDAIANLRAVAMRDGAGAYITQGAVNGLSGLTDGAHYFLGTAGGITTTAPAPSATVTQLYLGQALGTTTLLLRPGVPTGGA